MEVSDVRKRVKDTIEQAKRAVADRRAQVDDATREFTLFLDQIATPLMRQIANILRAEAQLYTVSTPGNSVRLVSDRSPSDYIELALDTSGRRPQVIVHSSRSRGRRVTETETPMGSGAVGEITEEEVLSAVLKELELLIER